MKKPLYKSYVFWVVIVALIVAGIFFAGAGHGQIISGAGDSAVASSTQSERSIKNDSDGYAFAIPTDWYVEQSGEHTVVIYPDYVPANASSSPATCKIEMSVFPYASSTSVSDWISARLSADPTVNIAEQSSENILIGGASAGAATSATAIEWIGTMNAIPTTLVYAFSGNHAYEIAPSALTADATCGDSLDLFLQTLTI